MPLFPGTGEWSECGEYNNVVNVPLRAGDGGETFREALDIAILPRLQNFSPDLIVISAGFDAHRLDPLANLKLSEADFGWATHKIMEIADLKISGQGNFGARRRLCSPEPGFLCRGARHGADGIVNSSLRSGFSSAVHFRLT